MGFQILLKVLRNYVEACGYSRDTIKEPAVICLHCVVLWRHEMTTQHFVYQKRIIKEKPISKMAAILSIRRPFEFQEKTEAINRRRRHRPFYCTTWWRHQFLSNMWNKDSLFIDMLSVYRYTIPRIVNFSIWQLRIHQVDSAIIKFQEKTLSKLGNRASIKKIHIIKGFAILRNNS